MKNRQPIMKNFDILIVDDDDITTMCMKRSLSKMSFRNRIITSGNGKAALAHLDRAEMTDQVLVFLDINMPVMDGWDFLDELQHRDYQDKINILVMSSSTAVSDKRKSNQYHQVLGYLEKPLTTDILSDVLDLFNSNIIVPHVEKEARI